MPVMLAIVTSLVLGPSFQPVDIPHKIAHQGIYSESEHAGLWEAGSSEDLKNLARNVRHQELKADLKRNRIVAVFAGTQPMGGYSVSILSVRRTAPGVVTITARLNRPTPEMMVTQALTQPFVVLRLQKTKDKLRLVWEGKTAPNSEPID